MNVKPLMQKAAAFGLTAVCCLALVGCSSNNDYGYTGGVAATVNGVEIQEDTITKYIQDFRTSSDLTTEEAWANWMIENSLEPTTVREQVIDYYVTQELTKQAAEEKGVTVDASQVDTELQNMKANYEDDAAWQEALTTAGITEDQYRESIEAGVLEQGLQEVVVTDEDTAVTDEALLESLNSYSSTFNGAKKSSHILFASGDEATAQEVLDRINAGEIAFADAAREYSTDTGSAEDGGNVGWDCLTSFVEPYTNALANLSVGQVSGLVTSDYGTHIITVTEEFTTNGAETSLDVFPQELRDYVSNMLQTQNSSTAYTNWMTTYEEQADVVINDMPENVPYNLDLSVYETTDETATDGTTTDGATTDGATTDATATDGTADATADAAATDGSTDAAATDGSADAAATEGTTEGQ